MKVHLNELYDEKCSDVVIANTFSVSRCIKDFTFPNKIIIEDQAKDIIKCVRDIFENLEDKNDYKIISSDNLNLLSQKVLEESYLLPSTYDVKIKKENLNKHILKDKLQKLLEQALDMEDYEAALYFSKEIKKIGEI